MRLFVAIQFSPAVRASLLDAISALRQQGAGRFTHAENLHLTLAFIGETENLAGAEAALDAACAGGPVSLTVGGVGHFGDLWWAGIRENAELAALALGVQRALRAQGFHIEKRPWKPHVTLARQWRGPRPILTVREVSMRAERVSLMKSERIHGKLIYTEVYSVRLGAG